MAEQEAGYTLGRKALAQIREVCRRVLTDYVNTAGQWRQPVNVQRRVQCLLTEHLYTAVSSRNDPSSAVARVFRRKPNGKLRLTNQRITVVNRFMEISVDEGTYCKAEWIDGEWQLYAADCNPGSSSSVSEGI